MNFSRVRDPDLLDKIDAYERTAYEGSIWRVVHEPRDPLEPSRVGSRWDLGAFDVLYTALEPDGAIAEVYYHLTQRQPVFPSRYRARLYELRLRARNVLRFDTVEDMRELGVDPATYREALNAQTRAIGDAAGFLGYDCIISPNARWPCLNATLIFESLSQDDIEVVKWESIDFAAWATANRGPR